MALTVGVLVAIAVGIFGTASGMDRDRAYYPLVTIVIGYYYTLFAAMGATTQIVVVESLAGLIWVAAAVAGFKRSLWFAAIGLAGHGIFDFTHGWFIENPGVPAWWPAFCGAFDVVAGVYLGWQLKTGRARATS